jgi:hypothetical protein
MGVGVNKSVSFRIHFNDRLVRCRSWFDKLTTNGLSRPMCLTLQT